MIDCEAFLAGFKPALYGNSASPSFVKYMDKLVHYPVIKDGIDIFDGPEFALFFRTKKLKEDFMDRIAQIEPRSPELHELLGITLGYPPLAARYYALCHRLELEDQERQDLVRHRVFLRYAGSRCVSHIDDLEENTIWLWNQYPINQVRQNLKVGIGFKFYEVEPYDLHAIENLRQMKLEEIKEPIT